jgi:hypothetical protein
MISLLILALSFMIYGEINRHFMLRRIVLNKNLFQALVNCNKYSRAAKVIMVLIAITCLCMFSDRKLSLEVSFYLLALEQVIPTRKS